MTAATENGALADQVNKCIDTGREVVQSATAKTQEAIQATRDAAHQCAENGRQRLNDAAAAADKYVETGRKVISDARSSAEAYQQSASDLVHQTVAQGRQRVDSAIDSAKTMADNGVKRIDETRAALRQRATDAVEAGKDRVDSVRATVSPVVEKGKDRAAAISANAKKAISTRDANLIVVIMAQIVATLINIANFMAAQLVRCEQVQKATNAIKTSAPVQRLRKATNGISLASTAKHIPVIGESLAKFISSFLDEVKKNM